MRYSEEIEIELPRERVIELFDDPESLHRWQEGLTHFELESGSPGQPGARTRLVYDTRGRRFELIETITVRDLPERFEGTYETPGMWNEVRNRFEELGPDRTRWTCDSEFRGQTLMMKALCLLAPGLFRKETRRMLEAFREFAEAEGTRGA